MNYTSENNKSKKERAEKKSICYKMYSSTVIKKLITIVSPEAG